MFLQHSFVSSVTDSRPLRELIAEAKAEVTEEIEEHKEEEEEEETEAHLVCKQLLKDPFPSSNSCMAIKQVVFMMMNSNFSAPRDSHCTSVPLV